MATDLSYVFNLDYLMLEPFLRFGLSEVDYHSVTEIHKKEINSNYYEHLTLEVLVGTRFIYSGGLNISKKLGNRFSLESSVSYGLGSFSIRSKKVEVLNVYDEKREDSKTRLRFQFVNPQVAVGLCYHFQKPKAKFSTPTAIVPDKQ